LLDRKSSKCCVDVGRPLGAPEHVALGRTTVLGRQRHGGTCRASTCAIETGVDDDAVQPGRHARLAAERVSRPQRVDECVLYSVGRLVGISKSADRNGPEPVAVPANDLTKSLAIARDVQREEVFVGAVVVDGDACLRIRGNTDQYGVSASAIVGRGAPQPWNVSSAIPSR
jgi:hypothetical protein